MNLVDKLMATNPETIDQVETDTVEIKRLSRLMGEPFVVTVKAIEGDKFVELTGRSRDKKGDVDFSKLYDMQAMMVAEGMVEPDLKNEALQKHYGTASPKGLAKKLFKGGEIAQLSDIITELSGYGEDSDEELKN